MSANKLARIGVVAALYAVLTLALPSFAYGPIQFRLSEVMTLLAFIDPFYILPLTLGCAISNLGSPFGMVDVVVGSFASFLALYAMSKTKNLFLASLWPTFFCFIIGLEILVLSEEPINFFLITGQIMISEFIVVTIIGIPFLKAIMKNKYVMKMLKNTPSV
ncbi:MAG TPA: QueT transporter family protein [Epulopiscium sp.]|nr:QueT transporter family protein [Candidatus Epulonipiscium sp.]